MEKNIVNEESRNVHLFLPNLSQYPLISLWRNPLPDATLNSDPSSKDCTIND